MNKLYNNVSNVLYIYILIRARERETILAANTFHNRFRLAWPIDRKYRLSLV